MGNLVTLRAFYFIFYFFKDKSLENRILLFGLTKKRKKKKEKQVGYYKI